MISYDAKKKKFLFVAPFPSVSSSSEPSCASGFPCLASTFHSAFGFPCPSPPTCFGLMPVRAKPEGVWSILWISMLSPCPAMKFSASHISSMSTQPVCHEERKKKKISWLPSGNEAAFFYLDRQLTENNSRYHIQLMKVI